MQKHHIQKNLGYQMFRTMRLVPLYELKLQSTEVVGEGVNNQGYTEGP
jgi:hypothetical protein